SAANFSCGNEFANMAAGDRLAAHHHHRIGCHLKAELAAEICQSLCVAFRLVPKMEILSLMHFFRAQFFCQHVGKFGRRRHRKIAGEGNAQQHVHTCLGHQLFFYAPRSDQFWRSVRPQNAQGMGIERNDNSLATGCTSTLDHLPQYVLVSQMHAVKVAHADNGLAETIRDFLKRAEDPHAISNSSLRPSWASRTCGGRLRLVSSCARSCEM